MAFREFRLPDPPPGVEPSISTWMDDLRNNLRSGFLQITAELDPQSVAQDVATRLSISPAVFSDAFHVKRTANQTIPDATVTPITWTSVEQDQGVGLSAPLTTITIPRTGWWLLGGCIRWVSNNTGLRLWELDPGDLARDRRLAAGESEQPISALLPFEQADTLGPVNVFQTSGGPLDVQSGVTYFSGILVAPLAEDA